MGNLAGLKSYYTTLSASDFRLAQYPDGSIKLQGRFPYSDGVNYGSEWRTLDTVRVDNDGLEIR